jgi:cytoskeleton-associated protein 5
MRTRIRAIFRTLCSLYPFSKVFSALLEHGVTSKNGRARSESVEELGMLFQRQGISVCQPTKALPAIAALIADRDATVRSAALNALAIVYTAVGDDIYAIVGRLPEKDRAMLDEKLKRTTSNVASPPRVSSPPRQIETKANGSFRPMAGPRPSVGRPMVAEAPPEPVVRAAMPEPVARPAQVASLRSVPVAGPAIGSPSAPSSRRQSTASVSALPYLSPSRSSLPPPAAKSSRAPAQYDVEGMCAAILSEDANDAVDALKQLQKDITSRRDALLEHVDPLVDAISHQMRLAFDEIGPHSALPVMRLCKHLMHALSTFFDERVLGAAVTRPSLIQLLAELTRRLLETADDASSEAISSLSKVRGQVAATLLAKPSRRTGLEHGPHPHFPQLRSLSLLRVRSSVDAGYSLPTWACSALFSVLQTVTADLRDLQGPELAERAKYAELVMKVRATIYICVDDLEVVHSVYGKSRRQPRRASRTDR